MTPPLVYVLTALAVAITALAVAINKWHSPLVSETFGLVGIAPRTLASFVKDNSNAHPTTVAIALADQMVTELAQMER
jgi:hypothetical protein